MTRKKNYPRLALNLQRPHKVGDFLHPVAAAVGLDAGHYLIQRLQSVEKKPSSRWCQSYKIWYI